MKILPFLFVLIIIVSSYANTIVFPNLLRRDSTGESEECANESENSEYTNECMPIITISNYKKSCSDIKSEKCQNFFNDPSKYFPICSKDPQFSEILQPIIFKDLTQGLYSKCLTDEEGNLCPYSIYAITETGENEALSDTCKSKKCTESLIEMLKQINIDQYAAYENLSFTTGSYTYQDLNAVKNIISTLESDKCKSSHVTSNTGKTDNTENIGITENSSSKVNSGNTSGAFINSINPILLISLFLLLLTFY